MNKQPPPLWLSIFGLSSSFIIIFSSIIIVATTAYFLPKPHKSLPTASPTPAPSWNSYSINIPQSDSQSLQLNYPSTWLIDEYSSPSASSAKSDVYDFGIFLTKPNLSKDIAAPDEPTKNLVMIDFHLKHFTTSTTIDSVKLYEIMNMFKQNFGYGDSPQFSLALKSATINNLPAYFRYPTIEDADSPGSFYPEQVLIAISSTDVLAIDIGFYFSGQDKDYYLKTVEEINEVISQIKITSIPSTSSKYQCADYTVYGKITHVCATCGNKVCEKYETCTASVQGQVSTSDCGSLYCPNDCK